MNEITNTQEISAQRRFWTEAGRDYEEIISEVSDRDDAELVELRQPQIIKVYDWGVVEKTDYNTGQIYKAHDFLVCADNSIRAIGIGDVSDAIQDVREELVGLGYKFVFVKKIPMKPGQCIGDEDDVPVMVEGMDDGVRA